MAAVVVVLCCCSMLSSSAGGGAFFAGVIPGTAPHFVKKMHLKKQREYMDMANELRLLGADLPTEAELSDTEDLSVKNKLIDTFTKIQEKSPDFCKLHNDFKSAGPEIKAEFRQHYAPGGKILTLGGMQLWAEYMDDYLKPSEDMVARYRAKGTISGCSTDSRDEDGNCVPFHSFETAIRDSEEACEDLKDMLEQSPEEIANQVISEIQSRTSLT